MPPPRLLCPTNLKSSRTMLLFRSWPRAASIAWSSDASGFGGSSSCASPAAGRAASTSSAAATSLMREATLTIPLLGPVEVLRVYTGLSRTVPGENGVMALLTTVVGSYPQPGWLIDRERLGDRLPPRVRARELWRVPEPCLEQAQDDATRLAVQDMERAGVDVITDGEMRRESYSNRFATALEGVDLDEPGVAVDRTGRENPVPRVVGPIQRTRPVEVRDVESAGADVVQIDEPYLQARPEAAREYALEAIDWALHGIEGDTVLHTCFGYGLFVKDKPSGYPFLRELNDCAATHLSLEAAQPRLDPEVLGEVPAKTIVLGVLDLGAGEVETPEVVAARIRRALEVVPPERLGVAPGRGVKEPPRGRAFRKLEAMVAGARLA